MTRKFYKTLVLVEFLSTQPTNEMDLDDMMKESESGGMSGHVKWEEQTEVPESEARRLLAEQKSDPDFFDWHLTFMCPKCGEVDGENTTFCEDEKRRCDDCESVVGEHV